MAVVQTLIGNVKGPQGDTGATGAQGAQGDAATIAVGSVTTAAYGTAASVTNSGTSGAAVFDFVIPQGAPGETVTDMKNLTLGAITASSASFPVPAVGETGKVIFGKINKWFSDMAARVATKANTSDITPASVSTGISGLPSAYTSGGFAYIKIYDFMPGVASGTIGTLPSALAPKTRSFAVMIATSDGSVASISVQTNGDVIVSNCDTSRYYYGSLIYPI